MDWRDLLGHHDRQRFGGADGVLQTHLDNHLTQLTLLHLREQTS